MSVPSKMDIMGTREGQSVLLTGVCSIKPINDNK